VKASKRILYGLGVLVAAGFFFAMVGWPTVSRWWQLSHLIAQREEEAELLRTKVANYRLLYKDYQKYASLFGPRLGAGAAAEETPRLLSRIEGLAGASKVELVSIQPLAVQEGEEGWLRFPVQVSLRCDLKGLTELLLRLRNTVPLTDVERLTIRADPRQPSQLNVQMLVVSYGLLKEEVMAQRVAQRRERARAARTRGRR